MNPEGKTFRTTFQLNPNDVIQIETLSEVITRGTVSMLISRELQENVVTFLKYQAAFGNPDKEVEQRLIDSVNQELAHQ